MALSRLLGDLKIPAVAGDESPLVFPSVHGKPLTGMALSRLLLKIPAVPHGFRSSGLGGGIDGSSARGRRGGLSAHGSVQASASAHGRLGGLSRGRASGPGGRTGPLIRRARSAGGRVRQALKSGGAKAGS